MIYPGVSLHARERMAEHHGRDLTRAEWLGVVLAILDRTALLLRVGPSGEWWAVAVGAVTLRVVWLPAAGTIATVLADSAGVSKVGDNFRRRA